jgi:acyl carrier protein
VSEDVRGLLAGLVADYLGLETGELSESARLVEEIGLDSIDVAEIVDRIERALGVTLPDGTAALERNASLTELVGYIEEIRGRAPAPSLDTERGTTR